MYIHTYAYTWHWIRILNLLVCLYIDINIIGPAASHLEVGSIKVQNFLLKFLMYELTQFELMRRWWSLATIALVTQSCMLEDIRCQLSIALVERGRVSLICDLGLETSIWKGGKEGGGDRFYTTFDDLFVDLGSKRFHFGNIQSSSADIALWPLGPWDL